MTTQTAVLEMTKPKRLLSGIPAVQIDARLDLASARRRIERSKLDVIVVRRTEGLVIFWYVFLFSTVLERFKHFSDDDTVKVALNLHEYEAADVKSYKESVPYGAGGPVVFLDGGRLVGALPVRLGADPEPALAQPTDIRVQTRVETSRTVSPDTLKAVMEKIRRGLRTLSRSRDGRSLGDSRIPDTSPTSLPSTQDSTDLELDETADGTDSEKFSAYPRLDTPTTVLPLESFQIVIGLGSNQQMGTAGDVMEFDVPPEEGRISLDLIVFANGFGMPKGSRHVLEIDRANPYENSISVPLVAPSATDDAVLASISVLYFYKKVPCGKATRRIAVIPSDSQPNTNTHGNGVPWDNTGMTDGAVNITSCPGIDLIVVINKSEDDPGSSMLHWDFESPHDVRLPDRTILKSLGDDAQGFCTYVIELMQDAEKSSTLPASLRGIGTFIASRMPLEFWQLLDEVAAIVRKTNPGRVPTVLFLTAEPDVPWELAYVRTLIDQDAPAYLGCQTDVSRWPLSDSEFPALPPEARIEVNRVAVVIGDYASSSGWRILEKAKDEGDTLAARYNGIKLKATSREITELVDAMMKQKGGPSGAEAIHFACHGEVVGGRILESSIILDGGERMNPFVFLGSPLGEGYRPFLFLNACQVGLASSLLGTFSGFAGLSLQGGFRGFLAPFWSVDDVLAHDIALEFYQRVLRPEGTEAESVASVLRDLRRRFSPGSEEHSLTRLAYVFYGHPCLMLKHRKGK